MNGCAPKAAKTPIQRVISLSIYQYSFNSVYRHITNKEETMKVTSKLKTIGLAIALGAFTSACSQETVNDTNAAIDEAQTELGDEAIDANSELNEFEAWVNNNTGRAENATAEEWAELRAEYERRETALEAKSADWDDNTRQEWEEVKADWNEMENKVQTRLGNIGDIDVDIDVERESNQ